jgi:hypothetical protein
MKPEEIGSWLLTEMEEFEGRTPADLIGKGETGQLWASLFYLVLECRLDRKTALSRHGGCISTAE